MSHRPGAPLERGGGGGSKVLAVCHPTLVTLLAQAIHAEAGPIKKDVEVQMEKELNHVHRREIDRTVKVLHFVGGEDSLRTVRTSSK